MANQTNNNLKEHRRFLVKQSVKMSNVFDKYLLTFSTGSLYLSIVFTSQIKEALHYIDLLKWGWGFLFLAMVCTLFSFLISREAFDQEIEYIDGGKEQNVSINKKLRYLQYVCLILFIMGVATLSIFYFLNL